MAQSSKQALLVERAGGGRPLLMLMDGNALVHRGYHAIAVRQNLHTRSGEDTTAVFGFLSIFLKALADVQPTHVAITFDLAAPTFRHELFTDYKAHRPETPQTIRDAFPRVRQLMSAFGVPIYEKEGFEADDLVGTLARQANQQGVDTLILTGDTDTLQLVEPGVQVLLFYRVQDRTVYDEAAVTSRYDGLKPKQLIDFKALKGDPSDNIPGVPGIGEKTAAVLLNRFGTVEEVLAHLDDVPERYRAKIAEHRDRIVQGKRLVTIDCNAPVTLDLEACRFGRYDREAVLNLLRELEFTSFFSRIPQPSLVSEAPKAGPAMPMTPTGQGMLALTGDAAPPPVEGSKPSGSHTTVQTREALGEMVARLRSVGAFAFDTETTDLNPMVARLVGLSFAVHDGDGMASIPAWYVPVGHLDGEQLPAQEVLDTLRPLFADESVRKMAHNANFDLMVLEQHGVAVRGVEFDSMIAAHLLGHKQVGLKPLSVDILGHEMTPITALIGTGRKQKNMSEVAIPLVSPYAADDARVALALRERLEPELAALRQTHLFYEVEMPLIPVLVDMQRAGIKVDVALLREISGKLAEQAARLEQEIYKEAGFQFNINSPKQLGDVLFETLGLPRTRKTRTGGNTTDAAALEEMRGAHPIIALILEHRQVSKLRSTYVDALPSMVNPVTRRVHTSYSQVGAGTGRLASTDPNLQNIPVRTEQGKEIRRAFVAESEDGVLLSTDYSQIELRVLAHISRDENLLAAFLHGEDIHRATASLMFNVPLDRVTPDQRRIAKVLNFGVIYGLSAFGISQQTEFTPEEGTRFIQNYFAKYPGIQRYIDETKRTVRDLGYVETLLGRRRYVPEIRSANHAQRAAAERMAINMPIQGTAAEIMKIAMVRVYSRLRKEQSRAQMLLQVHDELIFELPRADVERTAGLVREEMESAMQLAVPLKVDAKWGHSWGDME